MPSELTVRHQRSQAALRAVTLKQLLAIWPAFDITRIDESWPAVQQALTALIWLRHRDSSTLAARYYQAARTIEGVAGPPTVRLAPAPTVEQLGRSLGYLGTIVPKKLIAQRRPDAAQQTFVHVAGAVSRHVLNGGRDTLLASVKDDPRAGGWRRITSGRACNFCQMLAGRGGVYSAETSKFESHDHCACTPEPVFQR